MADILTRAALSPARRRLVELMQTRNHGRIEVLPVRDAEPVFDPPLIVWRLHVAGKRNGPHSPCAGKNYEIKHSIAELFGLFDRERDLDIRDLRFDDGLPCSWGTKEEVGA